MKVPTVEEQRTDEQRTDEQRTDEQTTEEQRTEEQRIEDLWFDDGNVKIAVGDRVCCVHRSVLARLSPVLRNMFDFPQPPGGDPSRMPLFSFPDRPDQVVHWLKAILLPGYFECYPQRIHKDKLLAVLRLSHKYLVGYLRERCLLHLCYMFGSTLSSQQRWESFGSPVTIITDSLHDRSFYCELISTAREVDVHWILPSLFYDIHGPSTLSKHWRDSLTHSFHFEKEDILRLLEMERLCQTTFSVSKILALDLAPCMSHPVCSQGPAATALYKLFNVHHEELMAKPLTFMHYRVAAAPNADFRTVESIITNTLCRWCATTVLHNYAHACRDFWDALPDVVGVSHWNRLRVTRGEDTGERAGVYVRAESDAFSA
ncbi:hypothetical protein K523DRAFT_416278 [Schizophyllum commune Tattone D]|nr:hypothetical protein K523DRAFT_416278 [Schizophyllum commune Tattone D]